MMESLQSHFRDMRDFCRGQLGRLPLWTGLGFLAAAAGMFALCMADRETTATLVGSLMEMMSDSGAIDSTGAISFFGVLLNNWFAMLFSVLYGFLPFLFLPLLAIVSNGAVLGLLAAWYVIQDIPLSVYVMAILPHGVFELPALFLAVSLGVALCRNLVRSITKSPKAMPMIPFFTGVLQTMLLLVFPLVLAAAVVETWVTPALLALLFA